MESNYQSYNPQNDQVDIIALFKLLWQRRKVFYWVWPITFVVSAALILCVPRYYTCQVILAPEAQSTGSTGSLQSLASSFGFDMRSMSKSDALYPLIYPEMVCSPDFLIKLFDVQVKTADESFEGPYYQYLQEKRKVVFWKAWRKKIGGLFAREPQNILSDNINLFNLSNEQWSVIKTMQHDISCVVNKKTQIITFSVTAQDKQVCATMADAVCTTLQNFVTDYRTQKARTDIEYYEDVMDKAYHEYQEASNKYILYVDSHTGINLEKYKIEARNLESEMQIKQAAYVTFQKQFLATQARLQENIPVYTAIQSASIPQKAAGPKRSFFVLIMLVLATCVAGGIICKDQLVKIFF